MPKRISPPLGRLERSYLRSQGARWDMLIPPFAGFCQFQSPGELRLVSHCDDPCLIRARSFATSSPRPDYSTALDKDLEPLRRRLVAASRHSLADDLSVSQMLARALKFVPGRIEAQPGGR